MTLPLKKTQHIIMMKTTTSCNRQTIPLSIPVPSFHYILFRLTIPRHVANFGNNVKTKHKTDSEQPQKLHTPATFWSPPPPPHPRIPRLGKEWSMNNLPETERSCRISQHTRELISPAPNTDVTQVQQQRPESPTVTLTVFFLCFFFWGGGLHIYTHAKWELP